MTMAIVSAVSIGLDSYYINCLSDLTLTKVLFIQTHVNKHGQPVDILEMSRFGFKREQK